MLRLRHLLYVSCLARALVAPVRRSHVARLRASTPSGIEYDDVVVGEGRSPGVGDFVSVIYETRLNGKNIDAKGGGEAKPMMSVGVQGAGGRPWAQFAVGKGKVIKGWDETARDRCRAGTVSTLSGRQQRLLPRRASGRDWYASTRLPRRASGGTASSAGVGERLIRVDATSSTGVEGCIN